VSSQVFPAPVYADTVLTQNFEDAKKYFFESLLEIHYAHTRMLARQGIISKEEERILIAALDGLDRALIHKAIYDGSYEDLFFFIESLLQKAAGIDVAGKMHTARSRNDIAITLYRMTARRELMKLAAALAEMRGVVLDLAGRNLETIMPAHTHTQPAQPTTLAHYLLGVSEFLARDAERVQLAFAHVNLSPMGAAALTTTGFPIDREQTARSLGFEGLAENSYAAIAAIDYLTGSAATVAVAMVNLGKFIQDLLLWSTREFGFIRLSDAFVQSSSIMPQKRNPVALEHARILSSRALGEAQAVLTCAHNTPFGDINDSEDDLQPLIFTMFTDSLRALKLLAGTQRSGGSSHAGAPRGQGFSHRHRACRYAGAPRRHELSRSPHPGRPNRARQRNQRRRRVYRVDHHDAASGLAHDTPGDRAGARPRTFRAHPQYSRRPGAGADRRRVEARAGAATALRGVDRIEKRDARCSACRPSLRVTG
jgi:argininosuccinate lyase